MDDYIDRDRLQYQEPMRGIHHQGDKNAKRSNSSHIGYHPRTDVDYSEPKTRPLNKGDLVNVLEGNG